MFVNLTKLASLGKRFYTRSPIVGVLGHVDHGKTTLIDCLRQTNVASQEAGGITQRNSIFQHTIRETNYSFTVVDTPGHAAFSKMRSTGTSIADIAILVVDSQEGVKHQTRECIRLLQDNHIPMVVALNKADLPRADFDKCYEMLFDEGVETEPVGGKVPTIPISALHGTNVPLLMQAVKSKTDEMKLTADIDCSHMEGIIFDIKKLKSQVIITTLIRQGLVKKGDILVTDTHKSSVRDLFSLDGEKLEVAKPGMPVLLMGPQSFSKHLTTGCTIFSLPLSKSTEKRKNNYSILDELQKRIKRQVVRDQKSERLGYGVKKVSFMLCADGNSSLEILEQMLDIETDELKTSVFSKSVGALSEEHIQMAEAIGAQIVLFNVPPLTISTTAQVHRSDIIYELASSINSSLSSLFSQYSNMKTTDLGRWVIEEIHGTKKKQIAGLRKKTGSLSLNEEFKLLRDGFEVWSGKIRTMNYFKTKISQTGDGISECGVGFPQGVVEIQKGDILCCFKEEEIARSFISDKFFGITSVDDQEDKHRGLL